MLHLDKVPKPKKAKVAAVVSAATAEEGVAASGASGASSGDDMASRGGDVEGDALSPGHEWCYDDDEAMDDNAERATPTINYDGSGNENNQCHPEPITAPTVSVSTDATPPETDFDEDFEALLEAELSADSGATSTAATDAASADSADHTTKLKVEFVRLKSAASTSHIEHYFIATPSLKTSFPDGVVLTFNSKTKDVFCCGKHPFREPGGHSWNMADDKPSCFFAYVFKEHYGRHQTGNAAVTRDAVKMHTSQWATCVDKDGASAALLRYVGSRLKCYSCWVAPCKHIEMCKAFFEGYISEDALAAEAPGIVQFKDGEYWMPLAAKFVSQYQPRLICANDDGSDLEPISELLSMEDRQRASIDRTPARPFKDISVMTCEACHVEPPDLRVAWLTVGCLHPIFVALVDLPMCDSCMRPLHVEGTSCDQKADLFIGKKQTLQLEAGPTQFAWAVDMAVVRSFLFDNGWKTLRQVHHTHLRWTTKLLPLQFGNLKPPS